MASHNFLHLTAILLACATFAVTILFTSGALGHRLGLFVNNTATLADKYYLAKYTMDVTPADWTFYLTALIYFYQAIWLTYGVTATCRKTNGGYFYLAYPVLPPILYIVFSFGLACNISWLLIWDREYMEVALVFINLMSCTIYICLVVSLRRLHEYGAQLLRHKMHKEIWIIRIFVHNGLAMLASWGTVAAIFNFAVVLTYRTGVKVDKSVGSTVSLTIFSLEIIAWWIMDNFVFEKLLRYIFTPYLVTLVSLIGILSRNWDPNKTNSVYTVILLAIVAVLSLAKTIFSIWRHWKRPLWSSKPNYRRPVVAFEVSNLLEAQP